MPDEIFHRGAKEVKEVTLDPFARELVKYGNNEEIVVQLTSPGGSEPGLEGGFAEGFTKSLGDRGP